jgi:hypothetical protein
LKEGFIFNWCFGIKSSSVNLSIRSFFSLAKKTKISVQFWNCLLFARMITWHPDEWRDTYNQHLNLFINTCISIINKTSHTLNN